MMPTRKRTQRRRHYRVAKDLGWQMYSELSMGPSRPRLINHEESADSPLRYGPLDPTPLAFRDDAERKAIWQEVRDDLMTKTPAGRRPWAWWQYDSPEPRNEAETQAEQLERMGILSEAAG